jgi:cation:H+ antiporter
MDYIFIILGLIALVGGGEILVRGATSIALKFKITPFVVGMTVVAFGTSAPELLVSLSAALDGSPDISIGNVVGSNIANIALVLGATALVYPIRVSKTSLSVDWTMLMLASLLFYFFILNLKLEWYEGIIFVSILATFTIWMIRKSRKAGLNKADEVSNDLDEEGMKEMNIWISFLLIAGGCLALVIGADWLVDGAKNIARSYDVSESVISLSMIAIGTSLPELATSIVAAFKKQTDIAIGNILGSNLFNILSILGITAIVKEINVNELILQSDIFWMLGLSAILLPMMLLRRDIDRVEGSLLLIAYAAYMYFLIS